MIKSWFLKGTAFRPYIMSSKSVGLQALRECLFTLSAISSISTSFEPKSRFFERISRHFFSFLNTEVELCPIRKARRYADVPEDWGEISASFVAAEPELYQFTDRVKYMAAATATKLATAPTSSALSSSRNSM